MSVTIICFTLSNLQGFDLIFTNSRFTWVINENKQIKGKFKIIELKFNAYQCAPISETNHNTCPQRKAQIV